MSESLEGSKENHSWSAPSHNPTDLFPPGFVVAVHRTTLTWSFVVSKTAAVKPVEGILGQLPQLPSQEALMLMVSSVDVDHQQYYALLFLYHCLFCHGAAKVVIFFG